MTQSTINTDDVFLLAGERVDRALILEALEKHSGKRGALVTVLQEIQAEYGYLPKDALRTVAEKLGLSMIDVYGVATFYRSFSLHPQGKHLICVCLGTACHVRGAQMIVEEFERQLDIEVRETTPDREFTLETVNCLGACALGPVVVIDGHYFSKVRKTEIKQLIDGTLEGFDKIDIEQDKLTFPINVNCPRCSHSLIDKSCTIDGHPSIQVTMSLGRKSGWLRLSSLYGSYNILSEHNVPADAVVNFFCPHCHAELVGSSECPMCVAPMVPMAVDGGGMVQFCSRRGCRNHMLDLVWSNTVPGETGCSQQEFV